MTELDYFEPRSMMKNAFNPVREVLIMAFLEKYQSKANLFDRWAELDWATLRYHDTDKENSLIVTDMLAQIVDDLLRTESLKAYADSMKEINLLIEKQWNQDLKRWATS